MRTLFITNSYLNGNGGGIYASRTHINLFAELSERMTLLFPYMKGQEPKGINEGKIEMIPVEDHRSNLRKFVDLIFGKVHRFSLTEEMLKRDKYDVVVFDSSVTSSGLVKKCKRAGLKIVTIHHNYQIEYLRGDGDLLTLPIELFWTWIYEGQAVRKSDINITLTCQDIDLLKKHYSQNAKFAVLGVYEFLRKELATLPDDPRKHRYVITGGLGSKQTEHSMLRWLKDYLPIIKEIDSQAVVIIAGSNPSAKLADAITKSGCKLIPSPPDMAPVLLEADYYICPIDCGGGLKLRNMDGLKYGLPVLSHRVSARGYERMIDEGVLIQYDNRESFKKGVSILQNISFGKPQIRDVYKKAYSFSSGIKRLNSILVDAGLL